MESSVMLSYALACGLERRWVEVLDGSVNTMETAITTKQKLSVWGIKRHGLSTVALPCGQCGMETTPPPSPRLTTNNPQPTANPQLPYPSSRLTSLLV